MVNLANCYGRVDRQLDALKLREETVALQTAKFGRRDYDTLMSMNNLAANYRKLDRYADAQRLDEETLATRKETLGPSHPDTLSSMWGLADDLIKLGRGGEAVAILDECLRRAVGKRVHRNFSEVADLRLRYFEKSKDAAGCRSTAELWEMQRRTDAESLYEAAVCRAVTAAVIRATDHSPEAVKQANVEADRAMTWLKKAVAADHKNGPRSKQDKDFEALVDRPDFQQIPSESAAKNP